MKKRLTAIFIMIAMLAVMVPFMSVSASAQTTTKRSYRSSRVYKQPVYKKPNIYQRHRNLFNVGIGAGAGALIGAIAGGKKGALLGALIGGGSGAVYTYGIKPKKKVYYARRY